MSGNERWRFEQFEVHPAARRLLVEGQPALLGARAFDVLVALIERRGRVVTRDELLDAAWPGLVVEENNLRVQISALRKLLGPRLIATVTGRGYQFTGRLDTGAAAPLPPQADSGALIGRDAELDALQGLLQRHRLVTVVGAGGVGKTRLAQAWAARQAAAGSACRWVELAGVDGAQPLPQALAAALALPALEATLPPAQALARVLPPDCEWLVLDNAEHLAEAVAGVVRTLLDAAPQLRLLVTSQVPLRLPPEQVLRLAGLDVPEQPPTLADAWQPGALALFAERARAADPAFEIDEGNVERVAEICRRLDGVPLAIELAAARVPTLGLQALAAALDERLQLLAGGGPRAAPARQRTLRAALDWSVGLLDAPARRLLAVLPSLGTSFTLAQAQAQAVVAGAGIDGWAVVDALAALVDGSLVIADHGEPTRYRLPETTRLYAASLAAGAQAAGDADAGAGAALPALLLERAQQAALAADGVDAAAVIALARRLRPDEVVDVGAALRELERAVELASRVVSDGSDAAPDGFVNAVLEQVTGYTRSGEFDRGTDAVDEALAELDRRAERQRAALDRSRRALLEAGAQQDLLRRDPFAVARRHEQLAALQHGERAAWSDSFRGRELQFYEDGAERGSTLALAVAAEMARRRLALAAAPSERADAHHDLARVLTALGERETGNGSLLEAVECLRAALADVDRHREPQRWALLQHDLADALRAVGVREGSAAPLEEAVACSQEALKERSRGAMPLEWAATQHSLGFTLRCLGQRDSGNVRLEAAARALREALKERTQARVPLDWARSLNVLGTTLAIWARREASLARYAEAVAAYREALRAFSAAATPMDWSTTQCNLGIALSAIGEHQVGEAGIATLRESIAAFRAALSVLTVEAHAPSWARVHHNLGGVLRFLGVRLDGAAAVEHLQDAVASMRAALSVHTRDRFPMHWAAGQNDLATALLCLGERSDAATARAAFEGAVSALDSASRERTRERVPIDWATTQADRAAALFALARHADDRDAAQEALASCQAALEILDPSLMPAEHAQTLALREQVRRWLERLPRQRAAGVAPAPAPGPRMGR
ncbi:MAG: helix-turn-helix transcriptional regulator [Proteobacteria bacterium]|nr:helix-turn-helix transcriptional regulator [Pseudomonadota bacterium]